MIKQNFSLGDKVYFIHEPMNNEWCSRRYFVKEGTIVGVWKTFYEYKNILSLQSDLYSIKYDVIFDLIPFSRLKPPQVSLDQKELYKTKEEIII